MFETIVTTFTTSAANEDILSTQETIKTRVAERLGITETEIADKLAKKEIAMDATLIFSASNKVSVSGHLYQSLINSKVYNTGKIYPSSIRIESAGSGTIMLDI